MSFNFRTWYQMRLSISSLTPSIKLMRLYSHIYNTLLSFLLFSFPLPLSSFHETLLYYESLSSTMASSINPTSIPSITALRQELDHGDPKLPRCQAFCDSFRAFRKTFVTSQGLEGGSFHDWRSREHQTALSEMVRSYLDVHVNGRLFWPDDNSQGRVNKLKYSTDSAR